MSRYRLPLTLVAFTLLLLFGYLRPARASKAIGAVAELVSVAVDGGFPNGNSSYPAPVISNDGRIVAFASLASDLIQADTNRQNDVFVRDRYTNNTVRASERTDGIQSYDINSYAGPDALSANQEWLLFTQQADGLLPTDTNGQSDVYLRHLITGDLQRISIAADGGEPNGPSGSAAMSADANLIAFISYADNLIPNDINETGDIFLYNRTTGNLTRANVTTSGQPANGRVKGRIALSPDGRYLLFGSTATNLVVGGTDGASSNVFLKDLATNTYTLISRSNTTPTADNSFDPVISADGRFVAFRSYARNLVPGDNNFAEDIFLFDRTTATIELISVSRTGGNANGGSTGRPAISGDGRYVSFLSLASNLVTGDTNNAADLFIRDRATGITTRPSLSATAAELSDDVNALAMTPDGRYLLFSTGDNTVIPGDDNAHPDLFLFDRFPDEPTATPLPTVTVTGTPPPSTPTVTPTSTPPTLETRLYLPLIQR